MGELKISRRLVLHKLSLNEFITDMQEYAIFYNKQGMEMAWSWDQQWSSQEMAIHLEEYFNYRWKLRLWDCALGGETVMYNKIILLLHSLKRWQRKHINNFKQKSRKEKKVGYYRIKWSSPHMQADLTGLRPAIPSSGCYRYAKKEEILSFSTELRCHGPKQFSILRLLVESIAYFYRLIFPTSIMYILSILDWQDW